MRKLSDTLSRIAALKGRKVGGGGPTAGRLSVLEGFGTNPGALSALFFVPDDTARPLPLVVVLHGCTQTASGYDHGAGWTQLAEEAGFAVLFPEQNRANNFNLCFNWYEPGDSRRGAGEPESIRQMVDAMIARHPIDPARIFVTGLSAGGAMTSVVLATYPELFAGGAIVAGLPYGSATTLPEAFDRMRGHGSPSGAQLSGLVKAASGHRGPWPTISIWHGSADGTVDDSNAEMIIAQWAPLHGVGAAPSDVDIVDGCPHRVWRDASGRAVIEDYRVSGMGHGTPVSTLGTDPCGTSGAYMLETGISSTRRIAQFWGLQDRKVAEPSVARRVSAAPARVPPARAPIAATRAARPTGVDVGNVINDALRAAGLMR